MPRRIALFFSFILHPVFFPVYALLLIDFFYPYLLPGMDKATKLKLFATVIINTIIFPALAIFLLKKLDFVKSVFMQSREDRIIPYVAAGIFYFWTFMVVRSLAVGDFITAVFLGSSLTVFAGFFFNLFFKISIHTLGAGAFVTLMFFLALTANVNLEIPLMFIIIFAGLAGSSRWYLTEHSPFEIFSGYLVGCLAQSIAFWIIKF